MSAFVEICRRNSSRMAAVFPKDETKPRRCDVGFHSQSHMHHSELLDAVANDRQTLPSYVCQFCERKVAYVPHDLVDHA